MGSRRKYDLTGQKFGKLTALEPVKGGYWLCQCECGNTCEISTNNLVDNRAKSCGCLRGRNPKGSLKGIEGSKGSICWDCIHSACPPSLQCSWDRELILPEGAETDYYRGTRRVLSCPQFMSLKDGAEILKKAREENNIKIGKDYADLTTFQIY